MVTLQKIQSFLAGNPYWQKCKFWYEMLSSRDRKILYVSFSVVILAAIYLLIWLPVTDWEESRKKSYLYQKDINTWIHSNLAKARKLQTKQQNTSGYNNLSSIVASVGQKTQIIIEKLQPDSKGLSVWIEDAAYQKLLQWLVILQTNYGVSIQQVRIESLDEPGRVRSYIHLR